MKTLIVYFSRSGHNRQLARELRELISAHLDEIKDQDPKGFVMSGWRAIKKKTTTIAKPKLDPSLYEIVILCTPMWVGGAPPATRTYVRDYLSKAKKIALVSVSGGGIKNEPFVDTLEKTYGITIAPRFMISDPEFAKKGYQTDLKSFATKLEDK